MDKEHCKEYCLLFLYFVMLLSVFFPYWPKELTYRDCWQIGLLWMGGLWFITTGLSFFWLKIYAVYVLISTIALNPGNHLAVWQNAYASLVKIAIGLFIIEKASTFNKKNILIFLRIIAMLVIIHLCLQYFNFFRLDCTGLQCKSIFNPIATSILLSLCLPAFFEKGWYGFIPVIFIALYYCRSLTGIICSVFAVVIYVYFLENEFLNFHRLIILVLAVFLCIFLLKTNSLKKFFNNDRFIVWSMAVKSFNSAKIGRGVGSWKYIFPNFAHGLHYNYQSRSPHNEFINVIFELGYPGIAIIFLFLCYLYLKSNSLNIDTISAIFVLVLSCCVFDTMHIVPIAVIGCFWVGITLKEIKEY